MDFLSRLLRKSPARDMFSSLRDSDPRQNTSGSQGANLDPKLANDLPTPPSLSSPNHQQAKNNKFTDEKNSSKERVFLTPFEDSVKIEFRNSPAGDIWPNEELKVNDKEDLVNPAINSEQTGETKKQKVYNVLTETFETPNSSIGEEVNSSASVNEDNLEVGQDPLTNSNQGGEFLAIDKVTEDCFKNSPLKKSCNVTENVHNDISISLIGPADTTDANGTSASNNSCIEDTGETIDQSEGIAVLESIPQDLNLEKISDNPSTEKILLPSQNSSVILQELNESHSNNASSLGSQSLKDSIEVENQFESTFSSEGDVLRQDIFPNVVVPVNNLNTTQNITNNNFDTNLSTEEFIDDNYDNSEGIAVLTSSDQAPIADEPILEKISSCKSIDDKTLLLENITLSPNSETVDTVSLNSENIVTFSSNSKNVNTPPNSENINTLLSNSENINTLSPNSENINTLPPNSENVNTLSLNSESFSISNTENSIPELENNSKILDKTLEKLAIDFLSENKTSEQFNVSIKLASKDGVYDESEPMECDDYELSFDNDGKISDQTFVHQEQEATSFKTVSVELNPFETRSKIFNTPDGDSVKPSVEMSNSSDMALSSVLSPPKNFRNLRKDEGSAFEMDNKNLAFQNNFEPMECDDYDISMNFDIQTQEPSVLGENIQNKPVIEISDMNQQNIPNCATVNDNIKILMPHMSESGYINRIVNSVQNVSSLEKLEQSPPAEVKQVDELVTDDIKQSISIVPLLEHASGVVENISNESGSLQINQSDIRISTTENDNVKGLTSGLPESSDVSGVAEGVSLSSFSDKVELSQDMTKSISSLKNLVNVSIENIVSSDLKECLGSSNENVNISVPDKINIAVVESSTPINVTDLGDNSKNTTHLNTVEMENIISTLNISFNNICDANNVTDAIKYTRDDNKIVTENVSSGVEEKNCEVEKTLHIEGNITKNQNQDLELQPSSSGNLCNLKEMDMIDSLEVTSSKTFLENTSDLTDETLDDVLKEPLALECDMLNTDIDGLESSDSDTLSVCSSINPSDLNPFETRCKIANSPERDLIVSEINPFETKCKIRDSPDKSVVLSKVNPFETRSKITNSPDRDLDVTLTNTFEVIAENFNSQNDVTLKLENTKEEKNLQNILIAEATATATPKPQAINITSPDERNSNKLHSDLLNDNKIKNCSSFKNNLEKMNDVSPDCNDNTPKTSNARNDKKKPLTGSVSPIGRDRRINQLSKRNINEKMQKVKNLSPMSRCGDLMGLSPVSYSDGDGKVQGSEVPRSDDLLTGNHFFSCNSADDLEEEFKMPTELFKDPAAFDYLLSCSSNTPAGQNLCKESLLVRFDPLVGTRGALPTGVRPGRGPPQNLAPKLDEDASTASGLAESCSSDSSLCTSTYDQKNTMSSLDQSLGALSLQSQGIPQQHATVNPLPQSGAVNVTLQPTEKPTQVVTPAISTRQQYMPSTPLSTKNSATPAKSVTSAIAAIDRLISLGGTPPPPPVVVQPKESNMDPQFVSELHTVREMLAVQEETAKMAEEKSSSLQRQLADAIAREQTLIDRVNEKNRDHRQMDMVMEEYERTMSQFIGEREHEQRQWNEERALLIKERDEANSHLANMEHSFNDIHAKYERCKAMIQGYKTNEEALKETVKANEEASKKQLERYEQLRQHAMSQLEIANQEIDSVKRSSQADIIKLQAMLKKMEIQNTSLQETITQKVKDIEELTAICDELIQKVG